MDDLKGAPHLSGILPPPGRRGKSCDACVPPAALSQSSAFLSFQSAELAGYMSKIAVLEDDRKRQEHDVNMWQSKVSVDTF